MMRALDLDFVGFSQKRRRIRFAAAVGICLCLVLVYLGNQYVRLSADVDGLKSKLARQESALPKPKAPSLTSQQKEALEAEAKEVRLTIDKLSMPWDTLFRIAESTVDENTVLLTLEPQAEAGTVLITAESRSFSAMLEYLDRLKQAPALHDVYISSHEVQQQDPQHPVRFVVNAKWDVTYHAPDATKGK